MDRSRFCYCLSTKCRVFVDRAAQSMHSELSANGLVDLCCEREPFGVARAACFEELACVFASCGALHYAKILASLKMKNGISLTPLNCALNECLYSSRPPRSKNMQNSPEVSRFSHKIPAFGYTSVTFCPFPARGRSGLVQKSACSPSQYRYREP